MAPIELRSVLASSDSSESRTEDGSSARAEWIITMAFNRSKSLKHHPLVLRVSITESDEEDEEPTSIFRVSTSDGKFESFVENRKREKRPAG